MAAKQITTVYFCQQVPCLLTTSDVFGEPNGMEIPVSVLLSEDFWPRMMLRGAGAGDIAILGGQPVQPIPQA